jgi:hypothetical protein
MRTYLSAGVYTSERDLSNISDLSFTSGLSKSGTMGKNSSSNGDITPIQPIVNACVNQYVVDDYVCDYFL